MAAGEITYRKLCFLTFLKPELFKKTTHNFWKKREVFHFSNSCAIGELNFADFRPLTNSKITILIRLLNVCQWGRIQVLLPTNNWSRGTRKCRSLLFSLFVYSKRTWCPNVVLISQTSQRLIVWTSMLPNVNPLHVFLCSSCTVCFLKWAGALKCLRNEKQSVNSCNYCNFSTNDWTSEGRCTQ